MEFKIIKNNTNSLGETSNEELVFFSDKMLKFIELLNEFYKELKELSSKRLTIVNSNKILELINDFNDKVYSVINIDYCLVLYNSNEIGSGINLIRLQQGFTSIGKLLIELNLVCESLFSIDLEQIRGIESLIEDSLQIAKPAYSVTGLSLINSCETLGMNEVPIQEGIMLWCSNLKTTPIELNKRYTELMRGLKLELSMYDLGSLKDRLTEHISEDELDLISEYEEHIPIDLPIDLLMGKLKTKDFIKACNKIITEVS